MERNHSRSGLYLFYSLVHVLLMMGATAVTGGSQSISTVGFDLSTVPAGDDGSKPDKVKGNVLLLDNAAQSLGVIFAFSVLVANTNPFTLQLYHVNVPGKTYHLGQEFTITPSVQKGREDIYIESLLNRRCVVVRPGDRLALNADTDNPAVQSKFNATSQLTLCKPSQTDGIVTCDQPYPLSVRATAYYIVSNDSSLNSSPSDLTDCPFGTIIPGSRDVTTIATTTAPLITGAPGVMGATGMQGATGNTGAQGLLGSMGQPGSIGGLGATGFTGIRGVQGSTGWAGATGITGGMGATGTKGRSDIGDLGVPGIRGPPGSMGRNYTFYLNQPDSRNQAASMSDESSDSTDPYWSSSRAIWATYLWMALVSFVLLVVIIVVIVIVCMHRSFSRPPGSSAAMTIAESRTNIMDDDAPSNYSNLGSVEH